MSARVRKQRLMIAGLCIVLAAVLFAAVIVESYHTYCLGIYTCPSSGCCFTSFQINWFSLPILLQLGVAIVLLVSAGVMFL